MNITLNTVNIKGTEYVTVNERIKAFWQMFPNGAISTRLVSNENGVCVFRCEIYKDVKDVVPSATGTAYERENSTFINKTSYIENCETSAIGRALGIMGIGIDTSVASADEVQNAIENQKKIDKNKVQALQKAIENKGIPEKLVNEVLEKFNYKKIEDILVVDYNKVCGELSDLGND